MKKNSGSFHNVLKKVMFLYLLVLLLTVVASFSAAEAGGSASPDLTSVVNELLLQEATKQKDAWQKAILEGGVENLSTDENTVTFSLRSFNPKTADLGAFASAEDSNAWLMSALKNASGHDLEITAEIVDGAVSAKGKKVILAAVKKAASASKKAFSGKDFTAALKAYLFPVPVAGKVKGASDLSSPDPQFSAWYADHGDLLNNAPVEAAIAAFYMQKSQTLSVKDGPHALTLTCVGASLSDLVEDSISEIRDKQAYLPLAERSDLENELKDTFLSKAISSAKKAKNKTVLTLDVDDLVTGEFPVSYRDYFSSFSWDSTVYALSTTLMKLPDIAAQPVPKAGVLSGRNKGTRVIFKLSDDSNPTYIIMRDANTDNIVVTAMALPKKSVTVKVPQGYYYIAWGSGPYWYGEQELFSTLGYYNKSERVEILSPRYYHTFKLVTSNSGNVSVSGANPEDLR